MKLLILAALALVGCGEVSNLDLSPRKNRTDEVSRPSAKGDKPKFAMVSTPGFPGDCLPGVVRSEPWGEMVATIPSGTLVWVDSSKSAPEPKGRTTKKWWRVHVYQDGAPISGWMHSGILKPPIWKEPSPPVAEPIDTDLVE